MHVASFVLIATLSTNVLAQDTLNDFACGLAGVKNVTPHNPDIINLRMRASDSCNNILLEDDFDYRYKTFSPWENTTWWSLDDVRRNVTIQGFDPIGGVQPSFTITVRTLTFENTDMDPQGNRFGFGGNPIGLTLDNGSIDFSVNPVWQFDQDLTIQSVGGDNRISSLGGKQSPATSIEVTVGSTLQFIDNGRLGPYFTDNDRLYFTADNSAVIDGGTLDIHRSHIIFNNDSNEVLVQNGGTLSVTGSAETTLETGTLHVLGGTLMVEAGENTAMIENLILDGATATLGNSGRVLSRIVEVKGSNTVTLGTDSGVGTLLEASEGIALEGDPASLTFAGAGTVSTQRLLMGALAPNGELNLTESTIMEMVRGEGSTEANNWNEGAITIGPDAGLRINPRANVGTSIPITNDGFIVVDGTILPSGTMSGDGFMRIRGNADTGEGIGKLGPLGQDSVDTFTSDPDLFMDDLSKFEVVIDPTAGTAQRLIANNLFTLGGVLGVYLTVDLFNDMVLPLDTKFEIATYPSGNDLFGNFMKLDLSPLSEGDLIGLGMNTYRIAYADSSSSVDGANAITLTVADADTSHARFYVTKAYSDDNETPVDVTLSCNGGLPLEQSFTISPGKPVNFTLTGLGAEAVRCEVTESGSPEGYVPSFFNHETSSDTSCVFETVHGANVYACEITNTAANAQFTVTKQWELPDGVSESLDDVEVNVSCSADILSVDGQPVSDPGSSTTVFLGDGESSILEVDTSASAATCTASETGTQTGVEASYENCSNVGLMAGSSEECTITNTVFFEGIPTLDRYGLALLAMLVLGIGIVSTRRII
jgi:hypothetical protein